MLQFWVVNAAAPRLPLQIEDATRKVDDEVMHPLLWKRLTVHTSDGSCFLRSVCERIACE